MPEQEDTPAPMVILQLSNRSLASKEVNRFRALMKVKRFSSWYQFCMEQLNLKNEPSCSLFMSLLKIIPFFRPSRLLRLGPDERPMSS